MRRTVAIVILVLALIVVAGCAASAGTSSSAGASTGVSAANPADLVSARCTRCHPIDRIKAARRDAVAWEATVERMRGKGAQLSDSEAQQVVDFLAGGAAGL